MFAAINQLATINAALTTVNAALTASNTALATANTALAAHGGGADVEANKAGGARRAVDESTTYAQVIAAVNAARGIPDDAAPLPTLQDVMAELAYLHGRANA
ncbi:uncharacterized protein DFL_003132 [Arthrobotrys flagrans]|uniref:Uncharacterized protein n=1 Tax=Arthrobotrys flagrans TaxID=97331 RepID=A0A437ACH6_ARTFL|nr:hypothetical protein DFL_003132 [Arthrobotrys flagrans]